MAASSIEFTTSDQNKENAPDGMDPIDIRTTTKSDDSSSPAPENTRKSVEEKKGSLENEAIISIVSNDSIDSQANESSVIAPTSGSAKDEEQPRQKRKYTKRKKPNPAIEDEIAQRKVIYNAATGEFEENNAKNSLFDAEGRMVVKLSRFEREEISQLSREFPDIHLYKKPEHYHSNSMIAYIHKDAPLELVQGSQIRDRAPICGLALSPDGCMLATFSSSGSVGIWDLDDFSLIEMLRDTKEESIDEFYTGEFSADGLRIATAGKMKDRMRWSEQDQDNHVLPCPIKVFDLMSGEVILRMMAHSEEVLSIKRVMFKGEHYLLSTSQDGYIWKWKMSDNWGEVLDRKRMQDGLTYMAFNISFVPNSGYKYFLASCDSSIKLFDFEKACIVQTFPNIFSCYCDYVDIIPCWDLPLPAPRWDDLGPEEHLFSYVVARGVEILDAEDNTINSIPNSVRLYKLVYPKEDDGDFSLELVHKFEHADYRSNSWLIKLASNGRYVAAPTYDGNVFLFHIESRRLAAVLRDHQEIEVRDVLFHPTRKLLFTSGDDGSVKIYRQNVSLI